VKPAKVRRCAAHTLVDLCRQVPVAGTADFSEQLDQNRWLAPRQQLGQVAWLGGSVKAGGEALGGNPSRWQAR